MSTWHWYDSLMVGISWGALFFVFAMRSYFNRQWEKKFGEKKPK